MPVTRCWIGIDIGTQGVRGVAVAADGAVLARAISERPPRFPSPGAMVHDPEADWWGGARETLAAVVAAIGGRSVEGVGLAGLFPAACLIDEAGEAIGEGMLYGDTRASAEVEGVEQVLGTPLTGDEVVPRLRWIRRTNADQFSHARSVLSPAGFVALRLTGQPMIDPNSAVRWGGIARAGRWDDDALSRLDLSRDLLAPIHRPIDVVGGVIPAAAAATGVPAGTPVVAGATDSFTALLGSGVRGPGDAMVYYGSSGTLLVATAPFAEAVVEAATFAPGSPFRLAAYAPNSGGFLERARVEMFDSASYTELDEQAKGVPPGANEVLVLPHVSGRMMPRPDPGVRGAIVGLRLDHGRADIWRAMLESFGWMLMDAQARLDDTLTWVVAGGTGARSAVWRSILTDMTGLPQSLGPGDASARGAAFLAAMGTGGVGNIDVMRDTWLAAEQDTQPTRPDPVAHERYLELLSSWLALDATLSGSTARGVAAT
ncbi:MAG TPA: FGGY family carbohydrate kinase [Candidatus Limnocylindrales bacterium]|nr:FGGY family carbohydrate kinase [Candidatus Limnocylindrales bacterium]